MAIGTAVALIVAAIIGAVTAGVQSSATNKDIDRANEEALRLENDRIRREEEARKFQERMAIQQQKLTEKSFKWQKEQADIANAGIESDRFASRRQTQRSNVLDIVNKNADLNGQFANTIMRRTA